MSQVPLGGLLPVFLVVAGPFVGSFLGLVADRLPAGEGLVGGRSRCDNCQATLAPRDLIPVVSWALAGGRCRQCGARLSWRYPAIELAAAAVALWSVMLLPGWLMVVGCLLGWCLLTIATIDFRTFLIPDALSWPLLVTGLGLAALWPNTVLFDHLIGALVGALVVIAVGLAFKRLRKREGIGLGDAKLLAAAGAWVGWQGLGSVLLLAAGSGLLVTLALGLLGKGRGLDQPIPFGPYLALGLWLTWLYGPLSFGVW
ncbi:MAG: A24 family peptidase [Pseudomonadota bacterium]